MEKTIVLRFGSLLLVLGLCAIFIVSTCAAATLKPTVNRPAINTSSAAPPVICNQPYGLCDFSKCVPMKSDPTKALCNCYIEAGVSVGQTSCDNRKPVDIYKDKSNGWMLKKGAIFGQLTSTYSFYNAGPSINGLIANETPANYNGTWYLKKCTSSTWANCEDKPCYIPPADPVNDNTDKDRPASNWAVCQCDVVKDHPNFYMVAQNPEQCSSTTACTDYLWSAGDYTSMQPGIIGLANYIKNNPDPSQPYAMNFCPGCKDCPPGYLNITIPNARTVRRVI